MVKEVNGSIEAVSLAEGDVVNAEPLEMTVLEVDTVGAFALDNKGWADLDTELPVEYMPVSRCCVERR